MADRPTDGKRTPEELCAAALTAKGDDYLAIETQLRQAGSAAVVALNGLDPGADPLAGTIRSVLSEWIEDNPADYEPALEYLEYLPQRIANSPITQPPPSGVAAYLSQHHEGRVTRLLALRLVKAEAWPPWKAIGVLLYLEERQDPETTAALLRFLGETADEEWRSIAREAVAAIDDADLESKAAAERKYYEDRNTPPPTVILEIEAAAGAD